MSHELRTPLNSSLILAKLLAENTEGNLTAEQVEYAQTIQAAGNDLLALINDILDLSKIEAGRMDVRAEAVSIDPLLADLTRLFQPMAAVKGLEFEARRQPGCPESINTDQQRLEQILKNLLSNAVKFTESGSIKLSIRQAAGGRIDFAVVDTGIGISDEQQQSVFEAFRQIDGTPHRRQGGTGLGLSISRELSRLLGGELRLASEPGKGSSFTLSLPASIESATVTKSPQVRKQDLFIDESDDESPFGAEARTADRSAPNRFAPSRFPQARSIQSRAAKLDRHREPKTVSTTTAAPRAPRPAAFSLWKTMRPSRRSSAISSGK